MRTDGNTVPQRVLHRLCCLGRIQMDCIVPAVSIAPQLLAAAEPAGPCSQKDGCIAKLKEFIVLRASGSTGSSPTFRPTHPARQAAIHPLPPPARKIVSMIRPYQGTLPTVPASCYIDLSAQVIGDVTLGENSSVWMNAVVRGDVNYIRIGANSNVQDCAVLHGMRHVYPVIVGDWVTIGHNATVHGCVLEDAVLVGMGSTIMNDCRIGEGSIIAAGAVIPEHTVIPPNSLVAGVPGKIRRTLGDADRELILKYAANYLDYTAIYLKEKE